MMEEKEKDPWQAALDQLDEYVEGTPPRSTKEYGCTCGKEFKKKN